MKKLLGVLIILLLMISLSGCALLDLIHNKDNIVSLGDGKTYIRWNLVSNNNEIRKIDSAYFEFNEDSFRYYENDKLIKAGSHRITYYGVDNLISPLHLNLEFGDDSNNFAKYDYIDCYTEDEKDAITQFTIKREAYHVKTVINDGIPIRDYHLKDMPYAFGTYVKESTKEYSYKNGKANYLNCAKLDGTFYDSFGNIIYFANNSYSNNVDSSFYTVYMHYENKLNNSCVEGTIYLSYRGDKPDENNVALIYVMHGESEPSGEEGVSVLADYILEGIELNNESITFTSADYYSDLKECDYNPSNFIIGTYYKE